MFTRNISLLCTIAMMTTGPSLAQDNTGGAEVARTVAVLPDKIGKFEERMPPAAPASSAKITTDIDPENAQFGVGKPATEEEITSINIDVMPDGRGLPPGQGTYAEGKVVYSQTCAVCHGEDLEGIKDLGAPKLIGGRDSLTDAKPVKTVESYWPYASTLFDYVHRAMPMDAPGSLSTNEVYAVSAYIFGRAGIIGDDAMLDAKSMAEIKMPNADGFASDPRPDVKAIK